MRFPQLKPNGPRLRSVHSTRLNMIFDVHALAAYNIAERLTDEDCKSKLCPPWMHR